MVAHVSTAVIVISGKLNGLTDGMPYNYFSFDVTRLTKITGRKQKNKRLSIIKLTEEWE